MRRPFAPPLPCLQWATFPLLQLVFQIGDWQALLANRTAGATMYGATTAERATGGWALGSRALQIPALVGGRLGRQPGSVVACLHEESAYILYGIAALYPPRPLSPRPFLAPAVVLGKLAHYGLLLGLPWALHGSEPALWGAAAYAVTQSIVLASTFAESHNVPESKPLGEG